jgi:hypothetical protein
VATEQVRFGGLQPHELRTEKQEEILRYLRSGLALGVAAKRAGVAKSTVLNCARNNGIADYARGKAGRPAGSYSKPKPVKVTLVSQETDWRARAASLRWGSGLGGDWL